jgi:uncharacterized CHY-type Zn-finger protein
MAPETEETTIHGVTVHGVSVDSETRCGHYHTDRDVIAIKHACCDRYYPCHKCHDAVTDHEQTLWPSDRFDEPAILCGVCGTELSVSAYLDCGDRCPSCDAAFNPGCRRHYHLYFETADAEEIEER